MLLRPVLSALLRRLLNRPRQTVLVQNPDDRASMLSLGIAPERIAMIPGSGVDVQALQPQPEPPGPPTVAFVGRLLADKGIRTLIDAHRLLRQRGSNVELLIAGTPDPANPASVSEQEAAGWGREPGITWLGHVEDISALWARAQIAVLPSRREGLPKSLLEAAACGRPMIATDVPGCREIVIPAKPACSSPTTIRRHWRTRSRPWPRRRSCAPAMARRRGVWPSRVSRLRRSAGKRLISIAISWASAA